MVTEPVRLVVWDLDETFWKGTLTKGGATYLQAHHEIVVELAKRGIMSSICSKNDIAPVREILKEKGLWDYFIFPSVDWQPKGARLAALIEAVQLRASTVLFVDDNPMNRSEAQHFVPGLQVADETIIPTILESPFFMGKNDVTLSRLKQYKLLETKQLDRAKVTDTREFLRTSAIEVVIEHELEPHFDRVIELINRTNQLNFTKRRLPEDLDQARAELRRQLAGFRHHGGVVRVKDRYGDYGYVGFYLLNSYAGEQRLEHFCFSCRTLGMGVEAWLYERLGRPAIHIKGEVLTNLTVSHEIDWINQDNVASGENVRLNLRVLVRGGCAISRLAHYLSGQMREVVGEFNAVRDNAGIRIDHSTVLHAAFLGLSPEAMSMASLFGYRPEDFHSALVDHSQQFDACVLNFGVEGLYATYAHPSLNLRLPFPQMSANMVQNMIDWEEEDLRPLIRQAQALLRAEGFNYHLPSPELFANHLTEILFRLPAGMTIIFLLPPETRPDNTGQLVPMHMHRLFNQIIRSQAAERKNCHVLQIADSVEKPEDRVDAQHFGRMVYVRIAEAITKLLATTECCDVLEAIG